MPDLVLVTRNSACRVCKGWDLKKIFSFGPTPPANAFLKKEELALPETFFPLDVYFCKTCSLLQLIDIVSPELLFRNYVYVSSTSPAFVAHFRSFAQSVCERFGIGSESLAVDIGSNDGIFLRPLKELGVKILGVDPAVKIAEQATAEGIETLPYFLNMDVAKKIVAEKGKADLVTGTNVFAHVNDLDELVESVKELLSPSGIFIVEVPYLVDFLAKNLFDTVYHEHLSYFALRPITVLFKRLGMEVFDVEKVSTHGGSLRIFAQKEKGPHQISANVAKFLDAEEELKLDFLKTYEEFATKIEKNRIDLVSMLARLKFQNKKIAGYGAPAKGNTLLNYFGIKSDVLDFIIDDSPWKQGLFTPGTHIPVISAAKIAEEKPDYLLILAWNFADLIMKRMDNYKSAGGKFILPVPEPKII